MLIKIALTGICVCIILSVLKPWNKSYIIIIELAFALLVFGAVFTDTVSILKSLKDLFEGVSSADKLIACLIKGALICVITRICCDIAKESGNKVISDVIELSGRIMLLIISLPFIESVVKAAISFVK